MKTLATTSLLCGLAWGVIGLLLEHFEVPGFCIHSGYVHLRFMEDFFYALGVNKDIIMIVFVLNFLIGTGLTWIIQLIFFQDRPATAGRE